MAPMRKLAAATLLAAIVTIVATVTVAAVPSLAGISGPSGQAPDAGATTPTDAVEWEPPALAITGGEARIAIRLPEDTAGPLPFRLVADGRTVADGELPPGEETLVPFRLRESGSRRLELRVDGEVAASATLRVIPGWWSLLPPLLAIASAILFRQVLVSLFAGIWLGALFLYDFRPFVALLRSVDRFVLDTLTDPFNATVLLFTFMLGGLVGVITRNGGTHGIVESLSPWARDGRSGQLTTWLLGLVIFFDDYTNTLMVGNTMRPVTDRLRISREKLAYLVDCTAAPVASVALISSWIGVEVGFIASAFAAEGVEANAYVVFVRSIPYRFYPLLALVFAFLVAYTGRDYGPMLEAERRARHDGKVLGDDATPMSNIEGEETEPDEDCPRRWFNAVIPIVVVILVTFVGMWVSGTRELAARGPGVLEAAAAYEVLGAADAALTLLWGSFLGGLVAIGMSLVQRILSLEDAMRAWTGGMKSMLFACGILVLAWSLGEICNAVHTADYLVSTISGVLSPHWLPVLVFVISAGTAFATGTSYGTMGILMPLVVPLALRISELAGLGAGPHDTLLLGSISSVLAGSVWGDHCSPISDTTILSSMASGSDHIDHVRTQIPYALLVGFVGMVLGDIPTAFGMSPWISYLLAIPLLWGLLMYLGRDADRDPTATSEPAAKTA